ncbi:MAG: hypothetical protein GC179_31300 [Anaerolineaceae bacterium]|nr:hypothetical protein [Anaerolineaceae bacterium]
MARIAIIFLCILGFTVPAFMQGDPPDYSIQLIQNSFSDDNRQTIVKFDVVNSGGDSNKIATATLDLIASPNEQIATATIPPLVSNGRYTVVMQFSNDRFAPSSVESFRATVGIGDIEPKEAASAQDNTTRITITFPANLPQPQFIPSPQVTDEPNVSAPTPEPGSNIVQQLLQQFNIDPSNPAQLALLVGLLAVILILALIIWLVARLLFSRKPDFGGWLPSYSNLMPTDPNTVAGRRQQWQGVAQNSVLPSTGVENSVHVRKLPTGTDDRYLSGWHVVDLRMSQYDMYGRVNRSQITPTRRLIRRLDWIARKHESLNAEQLSRQLLPVARELSKQVRKKVIDRTAMLPLAMDIRLRARNGEGQIWFELYRRQYGQWAQIDRWQPEMTVNGKVLYETFTYTLYGQKPTEDLKHFQKRLEGDLIQLLVDMFNPSVVAKTQSPDAPTDPHLMPVVVKPE